MPTSKRTRVLFGGRKASVDSNEIEQTVENLVSTSVTFRLPNDLRANLERIARREDRSLNGQALYFLRRAIAQYEQDESKLAAGAPVPLPNVAYRGADTTAP